MTTWPAPGPARPAPWPWAVCPRRACLSPPGTRASPTAPAPGPGGTPTRSTWPASSGAPSASSSTPSRSSTTTHSCSGMTFVNEGDLVLIFAASGPGYGDVLERDPEMVMADLREETISHRTARDVYKVVYRPDNLVVDREATELRRKEEREARIAR